MRTSLMRTTTKTNLPAPRHSNKHSPSEHLHRGENSPVFMCACVCVCFFAHPPPHVPMPVFLSGFSQGCWWKSKEQRCMLHPPFILFFSSFSCSWSTCTAALRGGVIQGNCSVWPSHLRWSLSVSNPLLNKPSHRKKTASVKPTAVGECIMYLFELSLLLFCIRQTWSKCSQIAKVSALTRCVSAASRIVSGLTDDPWCPCSGLHRMSRYFCVLLCSGQ